MKNFWKAVNNVIRYSDVLLEVLDARAVDETRNSEIEKKIEKQNKKLIFVINKCDMIEKEESEKIKKSLPNSVFVSATERLGTKKLREMILSSSNLPEIRVGVLGYPNTGKSSIINALRGRASAKTSPRSGFTRGKQLVRVSKRLMLIDTPGVFPYKEKNEAKHALTSARSLHDIRNPELAVLQLIQSLKGKVEKFYDVKKHDDVEETLEDIAIKLRKLKKGNLPDTRTAAQIVIQDWQKGKIR
ncbi:MAG: 50S ribosome-binding GTPase [Nanoarchaeota archaeon]|nr:50S ribosome-binding GTPase [Nanoarchaeota archaeon]